MSKANPSSTADEQESIVLEEHISEFPFWTEDVDGTPHFWGTHWDMDDCPLAGTEVTA
jgi:hypothetical protein